MSITLTEENRNNIALTEENRINSPTFDEMGDETFAENTESFETQSTPFAFETKNNLSLTLETK